MLFSMEHITKHQNVTCILQDAHLVIEEQDKAALIGVNGIGKSTLLRMIAGEEEYESGKVMTRNGIRLSYLPQNPLFEEDRDVLYQVMMMDPAIQEFEAKAILGMLGVSDVTQKICTLSGGQKKRVALARALLQPCDLLLLDEPTNHLDNEMIEWLETYLKRFSHALLMVTHDRYFLERVCNKMVEIADTTLYCYDANYSTYLELKAQREDIAQANENKRQNLLRKELAWVRAGVQARTTKSKERLQRFYELNEMDAPQGEKAITLNTISSRLGKKTIEMEQISKGYGKTPLFHDFTYHMKRNDRIGIIGPNGCGKTTLLHVMTKELPPDSGHIEYGETVRIAYFKQGYEDMDTKQSVIDYIQKTSNAIQTKQGTYTASQMLERFLFRKQVHHTLLQRLSGGERRRLYLLKVLMSAPNILFLDEPTNDLDIQTLQVLEDYLDDFPGAIVVVSHDRYFLDRICDHLWVFTQGCIVPHIGGYSAYMETQKTKKERPKKEGKQRSETGIRMSTKEKQEFDHMEEAIADVQKEIDQIDTEMNIQHEDFKRMITLSEKRNRLEQRLEELMARWVYLEEKKEAIEQAKSK